MEWYKSVRSLVTIIVVLTYCYMSIAGKMPAEDIHTAALLILAFYFTKKSNGKEIK